MVMWFLVNVALLFLNLGILIGLTAGALLLLRPLLLRVLPPQLRAKLWLVVWFPAYLPTLYGATNILGRWFPFNFRSLVSPQMRVWSSFAIPTYYPDYYRGTGQYNLALPNGVLYQVELHEEWMSLMTVVWLAGFACIILYTWYRNKELMDLARQGEVLAWDDPLMQNLPEKDRGYVLVRICPGLPTSFVHKGKEIVQGEEFLYGIYLQKELPPEQMALVLRHEGQHMRLNHCLWKWYANIGLVLYWWNPLIWLGYRYFCRDLELACDRAVMDQLTKEERRDYARTLVELGCGRQLWEAPLSFGESDAQLRVKAAVAWKPAAARWSVRNLASVALTVFLALFFLAGPGEIAVGEEEQAVVWQQIENSKTVEIQDPLVP